MSAKQEERSWQEALKWGECWEFVEVRASTIRYINEELNELRKQNAILKKHLQKEKDRE